MKASNHLWAALVALGVSVGANASAVSQSLGPFMPHEGGTLTTAWTNSYGPDAESWIRFSRVTRDTIDINYSSSRGTVAVRRQLVSDRAAAHTIVLGYGPTMPLTIENTTSLGTSAAVLEELRSTGRASTALVYNAALATMPGELTLAEKQVMMSVMIEGQLVQIPTMHAVGTFGDSSKKATGDFYFLSNRNNPVLVQYSIQFTGEKSPRTERIVSVTAGASERAAMEQALATKRTYDLYGIHFDFGKATIRRDTGPLLDEIAKTLSNNPLWTLMIVGHTDSIGDPGYNLKLSKQRAGAVKAALVKRGVSAERLATAGAGQKQPKATNNTNSPIG
jgi:outer membrane protein OmpA-like peptidoglycan-associated protein